MVPDKVVSSLAKPRFRLGVLNTVEYCGEGVAIQYPIEIFGLSSSVATILLFNRYFDEMSKSVFLFL